MRIAFVLLLTTLGAVALRSQAVTEEFYASPAAGLLGEAGAFACSDPYGRRIAEEARRDLTSKEYEQAVRSFRAALAACPEDARLLLGLARALTYQRELREAKDTVRRLLERNPDSEPALETLGLIRLMSEDFEGCIEVAEQLLEARPKSLPALKLKANAHYFLGEDQAASNALVHALEAHPQDAETAYMLGRIYYQQQQFEHAAAQFQRALAAGSDAEKAKSHDNLGLCYQALGDTDQAARHYLTAIRIVHENDLAYGWPYSNLAELLLGRGEPEKAYQLAFQAADREPSAGHHFLVAGKALAALGKPENSVRWLEQAVRLDPSEPAAVYQLARTYQKLDRKDDAKEMFARFQQLRRRTPSRPR